jgi:hypothetical protein
MKIPALVLTLFLSALAQSVRGSATTLWMRQEPNSATSQMVEITAGGNSLTLPFSGTTTYHFFSAPLTSSISLTTADKGGGVVYMRNTSPVGAFDFSASGTMQFFDYDPVTGVNTLMADTGVGPLKNINHGQTVNWPLPNVPLSAPRTLAAGHLLHIALTVTLTAGYPGGFGFMVYNASSGTQALFPQNRNTVFPFGPLTPADPPPPALTGCCASDGSYNLTITGSPGVIYTIEATTNLTNPDWISLGVTNANASGLVTFKDVDVARYPCRFYRTAQ